MEDSKEVKIKKVFRNIYKGICFAIIAFLVIIILLVLFFSIQASISNKKGAYPKIGLYTIISPSMEPTINMYDVVVVKKTDNLKVGDIITYYSTVLLYGNTPITHRIIDVTSDGGYILMGDANEDADIEPVYSENIVGKVILRIPQAGKLQFFIASKGGWFIAILIPAFAVIAYDIFKLIKYLDYKRKLKEMENKHGNI